MSFIKKAIRQLPFYKRWEAGRLEALKKQQEQQELALIPERKKFYAQFVSAGDLVFDVGANTGNRVQIFLDLGAKVVAVEPQPACVKTLQDKFENKITIEQVGLSEAEGELEMFIANESTISSFSKEFIESTGKSRFRHNKWENKITVPVTTMDSLINKYGVPRFCKIDVEGFELYVLKGLHHHIPYLSFEYCVPEMSKQLKGCIDYLHQLSPEGTFNYSIAESMELARTGWMDYEQMIQLASSEDFEKTLFGDIYFKTVTASKGH